MSVIKKIVLFFALVIVIGLIREISLIAGLAVGALISLVSLAALFKPVPFFGLDRRIIAFFTLFVLGIPGLVISGIELSSASKRAEFLAELKTSDPSAYLEELKTTDPEKWLAELAIIDPESFQVEQARQAEIAAQKEEEEKRQQAQRERQAAAEERRAEAARLAREREQAQTSNRITGAYVGCITEATLDEFVTAAANNDLQQIGALTSTVCTSIEGLEYSIVDRGWLTSQIRAYRDGNSFLLWTVSDALK
jgi:hypothetical protein